jgi:predicted phage terminase large subunit-like protein
MIFEPPRHGKSEQNTVRYPVWRLERDPSMRIIVGAYNQTLANKFSRKSRRIAVERIPLSSDRAAVEEWETAAGGGLRAVGVGGGITGQGGNLILIDDPVKSREEAESLAYRDRVWDWYRDDLYTRLEPGGAIILTMTRWHEDDLAGRLISESQNGGEKWEVLNLPALAGENDPLGREVGEALCPDRYSVSDLEGIKTVLGVRSFTALYQGRPQPEEGVLFKRHWFTVVDTAPEGLKWVRYWDLAASTKTTADYTASAEVALGPEGDLFIRDMVRGRWEWPDAKKVMVSTMLTGNGTRHGVEKALHGIAAVQELLRDQTLARVSIQGIDVDKDKMTRALPWAARGEAGKIKLIRGEWVNSFLDEVCAFPQGTHDDQVDTVSGGVQMIAVPPGQFAQRTGLPF